MSITSFVVVYILCWWLIFFMVLPFGIERNKNPEIGHDPGAPVNPKLKKKIFITSIIALILSGIIWVVIDQKLISIGNTTIS